LAAGLLELEFLQDYIMQWAVANTIHIGRHGFNTGTVSLVITFSRYVKRAVDGTSSLAAQSSASSVVTLRRVSCNDLITAAEWQRFGQEVDHTQDRIQKLHPSTQREIDQNQVLLSVDDVNVQDVIAIINQCNHKGGDRVASLVKEWKSLSLGVLSKSEHLRNDTETLQYEAIMTGQFFTSARYSKMYWPLAYYKILGLDSSHKVGDFQEAKMELLLSILSPAQKAEWICRFFLVSCGYDGSINDSDFNLIVSAHGAFTVWLKRTVQDVLGITMRLKQVCDSALPDGKTIGRLAIEGKDRFRAAAIMQRSCKKLHHVIPKHKRDAVDVYADRYDGDRLDFPTLDPNGLDELWQRALADPKTSDYTSQQLAEFWPMYPHELPLSNASVSPVSKVDISWDSGKLSSASVAFGTDVRRWTASVNANLCSRDQACNAIVCGAVLTGSKFLIRHPGSDTWKTMTLKDARSYVNTLIPDGPTVAHVSNSTNGTSSRKRGNGTLY
jgi:hypothetical protein